MSRFIGRRRWALIAFCGCLAIFGAAVAQAAITHVTKVTCTRPAADNRGSHADGKACSAVVRRARRKRADSPTGHSKKPKNHGRQTKRRKKRAHRSKKAKKPVRPLSGDRAWTASSTSASRTSTSSTSWAGWNILSNPIDPNQQTALPFGARSDYLQPWRAYLDTQPAGTMRNALGINFNVPPEVASPVAQFLAQVGFKRARLDIDWSAMSFGDPSRLQDMAKWDTMLGALKAARIKPLILLNGNDTFPGPTRSFNATITQPVSAGATAVQVDPTTAAQLIPGLSGFNGPGGVAAMFIATSISPTGRVTLSQPIPVSIPAGTYPVTVLSYQPFASPFTQAGGPNPAFEQTLRGWLLYVKAVTSEARKVLGNDNFDVEIWNELSFGSNFLDITRYYNPVPPALQGAGSVTDQLLARTVAWLRDPANALPDVGIGDGFSNQTPFVSGSTVPLGVTALDKHPYYGGIKDFNSPRYRSFFPEYYLSAISTDFMVRDISSITTTVGDVLHGRYTKPTGAAAPPQVWITETGFRPNDPGLLPPATARHIQAESALRNLSAYVNKGVSALYFYAVGDGEWSMIDPTATDGGETMAATKRFMQAFAGPNTIAIRRSLTLQSIADQGNWTQFNGDATHPPLYNRDVVAFLPFQADSNRFVAPVYVMTRNMSQVYNPAAPQTDVTRYDLPSETYRLTIGGLHTSTLKASLTDPMTGTSMPAQVVSTSGDTAVVQVPLTDYPRLLVLNDG
jgi:hypothetical protein